MPILNVTYKTPTLLDLPVLYSDLLGYYSEKKCESCSKISKESAVCLVCGTLVSMSPCCELMVNVNEFHSRECRDFILLGIYSTKLYSSNYTGRCYEYFGSIYLDAHGEEDIDLK